MILKSPTYEDVLRASQRLERHKIVTPVLTNARLNKIAGVHLWLKNETAQKTGSFKYRGAFSRLSALSEAERRSGVVAFSSGNHAQGIALAAKELGIDAVIVMPDTAPLKKKQGTLKHGAKIISYDPNTQSREAIAAKIAKDEGRILVPAFDDAFVIAGQGTCGLEFIAQCREAGTTLDALITPVGGGGLCAGLSLVFAKDSPATKIYGAEPVGYDDTYRSLKAGRRLRNSDAPPSLCDALMSPSPGRITFAINRRSLTGVLRVSDAECLLTMALMDDLMGVTLEPGGSAALAAVLAGRMNFRAGANVGIILSGGNVDKAVMSLAVMR